MSDIVTSQIFATAEKNITATKMNNIIGGATIDPNFYASKPTASSVNPTDQMLILSGGAYAQAPFSTVTNSVGNSMGPQITAVRLRSFNAVGNPTFEVDQRNCHTGLTNPAAGTFLTDRWRIGRTGTFTVNSGQSTSANILVPGTNFRISRSQLGITLTAQEVSMAAGDFLVLLTTIEGPQMRELISDVHSLSLMVFCTSALKFGVSLRDIAATKTLSGLCTIPSASTWTLVTLPNLPVWDPGATWNILPGNAGYELRICLAAGSTFIPPANGTWQSGAFVGAVGQDNFCALPVNATFWVGFVQHEPGATATTPIDKSWQQNYDDCLRYFCKSTDYDILPTTTSGAGPLAFVQQSTSLAVGPARFPKAMAKVPTLTAYNPITGAANSARLFGGTDYSVTGFNNPGKNGFNGLNLSGLPAVAAGVALQAHYTADTGW